MRDVRPQQNQHGLHAPTDSSLNRPGADRDFDASMVLLRFNFHALLTSFRP
jgi:hypothetical protein